MPGADLSFHCLFISSDPANEQVLKMIKRANPTLHHNFLYKLSCYLKWRKPNSSIWSSLDVSGMITAKVWNEVPPQLHFSHEEEERGVKLLNSMGLKKNEYVCYFSRDPGYLQGREQIKNSYSYHNYRDADINNYVDTLQWLNGLGYKTLRMGDVVQNSLDYDHPLNIDYTRHHRTDFGDAYIIPNAKFFIGDTAGIYYFAEAFNRPNLVINIVPIAFTNILKDDIYIPKKYFSKKQNRLMTFQEIFESGSHNWLRAEIFDQAGIELLENSPDEILGATQEMIQRLDGTFIESDGDKRRQAQYVEIYSRYNKAFIHYSRISSYFLAKHEQLLKK